MITLYTVILGSWDFLRAPEVIEPGVRYICYSDVPRDPVAPWEIQPAFTPFHSQARNARLPKCLPHLHFDAEYSIYHDANFSIRMLPSDIVARHLNGADIAMYEHPCRKHIGEEASCLRDLYAKGELPGLEGSLLDAQITTWKHLGAPLGLWAGGFIVRRHTAAVREFNETWWYQFRDGCTRDQIALPVARHLCGIGINTIRGNILGTIPELAYHWHAAWADKGDNPKYRTRQAELDMKRRRLVELARYPEVRG